MVLSVLLQNAPPAGGFFPFHLRQRDGYSERIFMNQELTIQELSDAELGQVIGGKKSKSAQNNPININIGDLAKSSGSIKFGIKDHIGIDVNLSDGFSWSL
jgi:hypothetical protein